MKQLLRRIKRMRQREPHIFGELMEQIAMFEEINIIFDSQLKERTCSSFKDIMNDYTSRVIWNAEESRKLKVINKETAMTAQNVLVQRVLSGHENGTYYYGTMSFIKFKKGWYYVKSDTKSRLVRLPTLDESYAQYTDKQGLIHNGKLDEMLELFFTYDEE